MMITKHKICSYQPSTTDACPLWMRGGSAIVRLGKDVFATYMRPVAGREGYNSLVLELYAKRGDAAWKLEYVDTGVLQSNPSPILRLGDHLIGVTANAGDEMEPMDSKTCGLRCTPLLYVFDVSGSARLVRRVTLRWDDPAYEFSEHDYRSSIVDPVRGDMLFTNMYNDGGTGNFCWTLLDRTYRTVRSGKLHFPERCCFHTMWLNNGACFIFAVLDVPEPVSAWAAYKKETTGNEWDYAIRRAYMIYCPDIRTAEFSAPFLVADREDTEGFIGALDCAEDENGDMIFVYGTIKIRTACMRDRFFPQIPFDRTLEAVWIREGKVIDRRVIDRSVEEKSQRDGANRCRPDTDFGPGMHTWADSDNPATGYGAGFHILSNGKLCLLWAKDGAPKADKMPDGLYLYDPGRDLSICLADHGQPQCVPDNTNLGTFYNSRTRLGALPCDTADLYCVNEAEKALIQLEVRL